MMLDFPAPSEELLFKLKNLVGPSGWQSGQEIARYFEDPRQSFTGQGRLVLKPSSTQQVCEIVKLCNEYLAGIIPYGGGTGVVAGQLSTQSDNAIILSLEKMNKVRSMSIAESTMVAEAGCILENVHNAAAEHGLCYPLSMASKGSCSIGGNLPTNAGGIQVLRYMDNALLLDAVIAETEAQRKALWDLREYTPEANSANGAFCNSDTSVPISQVDAFIAATTKAIAQIGPDLRINSYGHIGDGNIHHNVFGAPGVSKAEFVSAHPDKVEAVRMAINETTDSFGGSISAEHGIGRLKTHDLEIYVSSAKRDAMKRIKMALDPNNIMNPGALIR